MHAISLVRNAHKLRFLTILVWKNLSCLLNYENFDLTIVFFRLSSQN